ncbi:hypothetical protein JCM1840_000540 [Sporobolomyces johnsonii]
MSAPPPQTLIEGSLWPVWGEDAWIELAFLRLAGPSPFVSIYSSRSSLLPSLTTAHDGFPVVGHSKYKGGRDFRNPSVYECDDPPPSAECCSYHVIAAIETHTGELVTVEANLEHNHSPCEDHEENERLKEKAREAIHQIEKELCKSATTELERLFKCAGFRTGFEEEEGVGVPPHEEQRSVISDLEITVGKELARAVEDKARKVWMLVEGYAMVSRFQVFYMNQELTLMLSSLC